MKKKEKKDDNGLLDNQNDYAIRQNSQYSDGGKAAPNNNIFFENKSNPLSSKGN